MLQVIVNIICNNGNALLFTSAKQQIPDEKLSTRSNSIQVQQPVELTDNISKGIYLFYICIGGAENAVVENAGVENAGVDSRGGKCRSEKCRSRQQGWKMQE